MDFDNLTFGNAVLLSLFSMLVVFVVLLIISYMIDIVAFLSNRKKDKKDDLSPDDPDPKNDESPTSADKPDKKTAAIIAAAVTAFLGTDTRFVIRKIKRRNTPLLEWETAGISDAQRRPL